MGNIQLNLLSKIKKYLFTVNNSNFAPKFDSIVYLATYSNYIGSYILKSFSNIKKTDNLLYILKYILQDFLYSLNYINYSIHYKKPKNEFNKVIMTWAFKNNFNSNGVLKDRYFNISSNSLKKTLWFVVYMSDIIPKKIANNIIILKPRNKKSLNFFLLLKILFKNLFFIFKDFKYFLSLISNHNFFSKIFNKEIQPFLSKKIKYLLMPYEGQPFQNDLISFIKKKKYKIETIGYIHSPPLALPSNFVFKNDSPDKIILNGEDQKYCFTKILGWKKSRIKLLPSFRFLKSTFNYKNTIFLPLAVREFKIIIEALKYLNKNFSINLKKFNIRNHPAASNSKINLQAIKMINSLINNFSIKKDNKINYLIFIGSSGAIIEALERGAKVIQIIEFPLFDIYSNKIWPSIIKKKIHENIYSYELKKKGSLIKLGDKNNKISYIFDKK